MTRYEKLLEFATTDREKEILNTIIKEKSQRQAGFYLGISTQAVNDTVMRIEKRAVTKFGYSPDHHLNNPVAPGFFVKGYSQYYDKDGNPAGQWVKAQADAAQQAALVQEAIEALASSMPRAAKIKAPKYTEDNLANQYTITDYHIGMMAWGQESGEDWDIKKSEQTLIKWFDRAIALAPDAELGIFAQLGDFLHWDGLDAVTPASKHLLDADTRFRKTVRVAMRVSRYIIERLLEKHKNVYILMAEGNHDPAGSIWLSELFNMHYSTEPRVTVDTNADVYYCLEHGDVSLFYHHGHKKKPTNIDDVFVAKYRDVFGRTKFSYAHMGHLHHDKVIESNLMTIEQHRTLAANDAYSSRGGWLSGRDAKVITYHKRYGEVGRITVSPDMIK